MALYLMRLEMGFEGEVISGRLIENDKYSDVC